MRLGSRPFGFAVLLLAALAGSVPAGAETAGLITRPADDAQLATLPGNLRPEANATNDRGLLAGGTRLEHMHLQLQRDAAGDAAVAAYVAAQHDPASTLFHKWLTAEQFGARFGLGAADLGRVTAWLAARGLTVNAVYPNRMVIDFSGTAEQVGRAFHTEMHRFAVAGATHIANAADPSVPAALAPAVAGIVSLHDFRATPRYRAAPRYTRGGQLLVAPPDLATIYNFSPAFAAGITGRGQIIAAVEPTNLYSTADWTRFRAALGLSGYSYGALVVQQPPMPNGTACANPGVTGDDIEAALDVEWATAAAPNAEILLAACASTATTDGTYLAIQNLVNAKTPPPIITVSYGVCETQNGASANKAFAYLYQQAAAEGISVFVATGDNGPSDCAANGQIGAKLGVGANGWASTAYNVAVGGTDFGDTSAGTTGTYWGKTNGAGFGSALSYIPEIPWNGNCASLLIATAVGVTPTYGATGFCNVSAGTPYRVLDGGEGAPSGCATGVPAKAGVVGGTCKGTPKPSWQTGVLGSIADGVRDTPDVSLFASDGSWGHYYVTCFSDPNNGGGSCAGSPGTWLGGGGGTSYSTPIMAGIQALVNQKRGARQGNPAPVLYALAAAEYGKTGSAACNAGLGKAIGAGCVFNDITTGDDNSDCTAGTANCYTPSGKLGVLSASATAYAPDFTARTGYDLPTGLGSVNVTNLVNSWPDD